MNVTDRLDLIAERLDRKGHPALAGMIDKLATQYDGNVTRLDTLGYRLDQAAQHGGGFGRACAWVAECLDQIAETADTPVTATANATASKLENLQGRLVRRLERYGVASGSCRDKQIHLNIVRGGVKTVAKFTRDKSDRVSVVFRCGTKTMRRHIQAKQLTAAHLLDGAEHVFRTGENYEV